MSTIKDFYKIGETVPVDSTCLPGGFAVRKDNGDFYTFLSDGTKNRLANFSEIDGAISESITQLSTVLSSSIYPSSGIIDIAKKSDTFFETDIPNTYAYAGEVFNVNGEVIDTRNEELATLTKIEVLSAPSSTNFGLNSFSTEVGKTYIFCFEVSELEIGALGMYVSGVNSSEYKYIAGSDKYCRTFIATSTSHSLYGRTAGITTGSISNISVREANLIELPVAPTATVESTINTTRAYSVGEQVVLDRPNLVTNGTSASIIRDDATSQSITYTTNSFLSTDSTLRFTVSNIVGSILVDESHTLTENGDYVFNTVNSSCMIRAYDNGSADISNISIKPYDEVFQTIQDAPIGTSLLDSTYFEPREEVNRHDIALYRVSKTDANNRGFHTYGSLNLFEKTDNPHTIMSKEGYSFVGAGVWEDDDYYYSFINLVQRLNKGSYNPFRNPLGTCRQISALRSGGSFWYGDAYPVEYTYQLFAYYGTSTDGVYFDTGYIGGSGTGRPDSKLYDKIYLNQILDYRLSATQTKNQQLLTNQLRNDLTGVTEGIDSSVKSYESTKFSGVNASNYYGLGTSKPAWWDKLHVLGKVPKGIHFDIAGITHSGNGDTVVNGGVELYQSDAFNSGQYSIRLDIATATTSDDWVVVYEDNNHLSQGTQLSIDLIGSPDNYHQSLKDMLAEGKAVNGIYPSIINPISTVSVNKKYNILINEMGFKSDGTWFATIRNYTPVVNNSIYLNTTAYADVIVALLNYTSHNSILQDYTDGEPLTEDLVVYASNTHDVEAGALIANSLTDKVSTGTDSTEALTVTKVVDGVITHTDVTAIDGANKLAVPDVLFRARLEKDTATGLKKIVYEYDGTTIDGLQLKQRLLNEYA